MKTYLEFSEGLKDYTDQGKNIRVPGEDKASFSKLFKDDLKQMGKYVNPKTKKIEYGLKVLVVYYPTQEKDINLDSLLLLEVV